MFRTRRARCARCGTWTTYPIPTRAELAAAYGTWYRPPAGRFAGFGDALFRWLRGSIARRIDAAAPPGPILDVGAGEGVVVDALTRRGRRAEGVDPYVDRPGFIKRDIEDLDGAYAGIVFWHSLEHMADPTRALHAAVRLLQPGGTLFIAVPNIASLQAALFGDRWLHLDIPRHLVHIPAGTLMDVLRSLGLSIEKVSFFRGGHIVFGWLHGLVGTLSSKLDLYDAIRKTEARSKPMSTVERMASIAVGALLLPVAMIAGALEVLLRRGGTVYVQARAAR